MVGNKAIGRPKSPKILAHFWVAHFHRFLHTYTQYPQSPFPYSANGECVLRVRERIRDVYLFVAVQLGSFRLCDMRRQRKQRIPSSHMPQLWKLAKNALAAPLFYAKPHSEVIFVDRNTGLLVFGIDNEHKNRKSECSQCSWCLSVGRSVCRSS